MKKQLRIGFFLLFFLFFILAGSIGVFRAKVRWTPSEGVEAGDTWINKYLPARQQLLLPYRLWNSALDKRYYPEIKSFLAENGQMLPTSELPKIKLKIKQVSQLASWCNERGIHFLYVIYPGKPRTDEELTELGFPSARNKVAVQMTEALREQQISFLDLREVFLREEDYYAFFYKTEHHWTADAGVIAARMLAERLNAEFDAGLDIGRLEEDRIGRTVYPGAFVGEQGMKTLGKYGERDDFVVRFPLYTTHLRYSCPEDRVDVSGGFEILTNDRTLKEDHLNGGRSLYYYYLFKNSGLVEIWDEDAASGDIFLIKDSFSNVVTPFLALTAKHITTWDMRRSNQIYAYLKEHPEIDTVVVAYTVSSVLTKEMNDFQ